MTSRASFGRLKLVLRLELPLPARIGVVERPELEKDVRRDGGEDPPPVAPVLLVGDMGGGLAMRPFRSNDGMSAQTPQLVSQPGVRRGGSTPGD